MLLQMTLSFFLRLSSILFVYMHHIYSLPWRLRDKESACNAEAVVWALGWKDPLEEGTQSTPVFLPGESHGQRSLAGYHPYHPKEVDMTEMT